MNHLSAYFIFLIFLISCQNIKVSDEAIVTGNFRGAADKIIVLEELKTQRLIPVDSAKIDSHGNFRLSVLPAEKSFYLLRVDDFPTISLVLDKQDSLFVHADTLQILKTYNVLGNEESFLLQQYHLETGVTKSTLDSLRQVLFENQYKAYFPEIKKSIDSTLEIAMENHHEATRQLILQNPGNLANLLLINGTLVGRQIFKIENDEELYFQIEDRLVAEYPDNSHVKIHVRRMDEWRNRQAEKKKAEERLAIGRQVPRITLHDVNGKARSISELTGKNVILFFWASWSPESRADIQLLKSKYPTIKKNNMEIFAVSLDHKLQFWKAAVKTENLQWINVSDPTGPGGTVAELFNIEDGLPYYFHIDPQGCIRAKTGDFTDLINSVDSLIHNSQL